jgi:signal transduction histidine kinase
MSNEESILRQILQELKEIKQIVKVEADTQRSMRKSVFDLHKPELERLGRGILEQIAKDKGWDKEIERSGHETQNSGR